MISPENSSSSLFRFCDKRFTISSEVPPEFYSAESKSDVPCYFFLKYMFQTCTSSKTISKIYYGNPSGISCERFSLLSVQFQNSTILISDYSFECWYFFQYSSKRFSWSSIYLSYTILFSEIPLRIQKSFAVYRFPGRNAFRYPWRNAFRPMYLFKKIFKNSSRNNL